MAVGFLLRVGGVWVPLAKVQIGATIEADRLSSELVTSGGTRFVQRAPKAPRTWNVSLTDNPTTWRWLAHAAKVAGDYRLYDVAAAKINLLPAELCTGAAAGITTNDGVSLGTLAAGAVATATPLRNTLYTLSGWTTAAAGATIATYNIGAGNVNIVAPAGAGSRYWTVTFTPADGATFTYTQTTAANTTALRLSEGARTDTTAVTDLGYLAGERTPTQVSVKDPSRVLHLVASGRLPWLNQSFQLLEVA